jgi:protein phosphatase
MGKSVRYIRGSATAEGRLGRFARDERILKTIRNSKGVRILQGAVADDSGPYPSGTNPSELAIEMVREFFGFEAFRSFSVEESEELISEGIKDLFNRINSAVYSQGIKEGHASRLSLSVIIMVNDRLYAGHVGKGRIIILRPGGVEQLSQDHSWLIQAIKKGELSLDMAMPSQPQDTIPVMGTDSRAQCQFIKYEMKPGDRAAVFSDGIGDLLPNTEISVIFRSADSIQAACNRLTDIARERGLAEAGSVISFAVETTDWEKKSDFDEIVQAEKKPRGKGSFCGCVFFVSLVMILALIAAASYVGFENAQKYVQNISFPTAIPIPISNPTPSDTPAPPITRAVLPMEGGNHYFIRDSESAPLEFFRFNGKKLEPSQVRFEVTEGYNQVELLPATEGGGYTAVLRFAKKSFYEVLEGSTRNKAIFSRGNARFYLTRGASALVYPDEAKGMTTVELKNLHGPIIVYFDRQSLILKINADEVKKPEPAKK